MFNSSNGFTMPVVPAGYGNNNGMFGNDSDLLALIILFALFGGNGFGFGGFGFGGGAGLQGMATRADINEGFALQNITGGIQSIQQGICDSTYALNNSITNGFYGLQSQLADCCCGTKAEIADVKYQMASQACDTRNVIQTATRDILESNNANTRAILDFLTTDKIASLQAENQSLKLSASQANQNAVLMAAMDSNKAEILRKTGAECPTAAYIVQPPTPVTFPQTCGCGGYGAYGYGAVVGA